MVKLDSPTPEGLILHEEPQPDGSSLVEEIGKIECVIHRYRVCGLDEFESFYLVEDSVDFILGRLAFIENQCDEHKGENPHSIEGLAWRWNRKRARRRLRRWMNEHNSPDCAPRLPRRLR